jgi:PAS domain S-box-containing protein
MHDFPAPIRDFMLNLTVEERAPAYLLVDDEGRPSRWGGGWAAYGVSGLRAGDDAVEQIPLLAGLLPLGGPSAFLPYVTTDGGAFADLYLFRGEEGTWVLLLDSTADASRRQGMQQAANELRLRVSEMEREEETLYEARGRAEERLAEQNAALARANRQLLQELAGREREQAALAESEARFRRLFDSNVIGILFRGPRGVVTEANDAFLGMLGYTREELSDGALRWDQIAGPEGAAEDARALAAAPEAGTPEPRARWFVRRDGARVNLLFGAAPLPGSQNEIVCFALDPAARR